MKKLEKYDIEKLNEAKDIIQQEYDFCDPGFSPMKKTLRNHPAKY